MRRSLLAVALTVACVGCEYSPTDMVTNNNHNNNGQPTPSPTPACTRFPSGATCTSNFDCCSLNCVESTAVPPTASKCQ